MITAIIIDDEQLARETLLIMLEHYFKDKIKVLADVPSIKEGVFAITYHKPDLVFLDIEMPNENGLKLFTYFKEILFSVIFVTAHNRFAIEALKLSALDYILKPVNFIDLKETINLYEKKVSKGVSQQKVESLFQAMNPMPDPYGKIALPTFTGFQLEKISTIMYCEADQNYTKLYIFPDKTILVSKSISYVEDSLPKEIFFRIHKSYLVNMNYIKSYNRTDGYRVELENGVMLDVASRRHQKFVTVLTNGNSKI